MIDLLQQEKKRTFGVPPAFFIDSFLLPLYSMKKNITIIDFLLDFTTLSMYFI